MAKKEKRFVTVLSESNAFAETTKIFVDKETGVNYLFVSLGYGGGLTPLLDRNGNVVVTSVSKSYDLN